MATSRATASAARPTSSTRPLVPPGANAPVGAAPMSARRGRDKAPRWLPLLLIAVLVAGLAVAYVSQLGHHSTVTAATTARSIPAKPKATAPKISRRPTAPARPPTAAPTLNPDVRLGRFLSSYYSEVTRDTSLTWSQLTPTMQKRAAGRGGYDGFWSTIASVRVNSTQANTAGTSAVVHLTFTKTNGVTSSETHRFTFVSQSGSYLIDSDTFTG
jgi:eukaryotic-like serine/threonine-protein kinase